MNDKKEKRFITVETDDGDTYYGRLLGLVNDKEFHCIVNDRKLQNQTFSVETISLNDITNNYDDFNGLRLIVALKKINEKDVGGKSLFISEQLDLLGYVSTDQAIGIIGKEDEYFTLTEEIE